MSAIGISPTDLAKALQLCKWIYDHCYDQANTAVPRYRQFVRDIRGLENTLELLKKQVAFQQQNLGPFLDPFSTESHAGAKKDFLEVVGDYEETLKECYNLLRTHSSIERDGAGFVKNVQWGASIQAKIDGLLARIQAHNGKIHLLLEPIRNNQLQGIETTILAVLELLDPPPEIPAHGLSPQIDEKFREALQHSLASRSIDFSRVTRREKLDSLYRVWQASAPSTAEGAERSVEQQLSLLKSGWLIKKLKIDDSFKTARRGFPYRRTIFEIQKLVANELALSQGKILPTEELLRLDATAFRIIQADLPEVTTPVVDERPLEKKLLEIPLPDIQGCVSHTLMIYRSTPDSIRLLEEITSNARTKSRESAFDFRTDILLPYYAVPGEGTSLTLVMRNRAGSRKTPYQLKRAKDLFDIQRAITGYEVLSDFDGASFTAHKTVKRLGRQDVHGSCRIQMWRWRPLQALEIEQTLSARRKSSIGSVLSDEQLGSNMSHSTTSTWQNVIQGLHPSLVDNSFVSLIGQQDGKKPVIATRAPLPPVLVLYTNLDDALAFVTIDLTQDIYKKDSNCRCSSKANTCVRTVLRNRSGSLILRKFSTHDSSLSGAHLDRWDLSVIGCPSSEKPEFHQDYDSKAMQRIEAKYLALDFPSVEARIKFDKEMNTVAFMRNDEENKLQAFYRHASTLQGQPRIAVAPISPTSPSAAPSNSSQSTIRPTSFFSEAEPPKLDVDITAWRSADPD